MKKKIIVADMLKQKIPDIMQFEDLLELCDQIFLYEINPKPLPIMLFNEHQRLVLGLCSRYKFHDKLARCGFDDPYGVIVASGVISPPETILTVRGAGWELKISSTIETHVSLTVTYYDGTLSGFAARLVSAYGIDVV